MRRRVGLGATHQKRLEEEKYKNKSTSIQNEQLKHLSSQLAIFQSKLEEFAAHHKNDIIKNAQLRAQFQKMCATIGVDPLASTKGFWSILGISDFYFELSVQLIEVCMATLHNNGGLITLNEIRERLIKARGAGKHHQEITIDDLLCAGRTLKIFGNGFSVTDLENGNYIVQSVPGELNLDETEVLKLITKKNQPYLSVLNLELDLLWKKERCQNALDKMVKEGLVWVDECDNNTLYWFPSLFAECMSSEV